MVCPEEIPVYALNNTLHDSFLVVWIHLDVIGRQKTIGFFKDLFTHDLVKMLSIIHCCNKSGYGNSDVSVFSKYALRNSPQALVSSNLYGKKSRIGIELVVSILPISKWHAAGSVVASKRTNRTTFAVYSSYHLKTISVLTFYSHLRII